MKGGKAGTGPARGWTPVPIDRAASLHADSNNKDDDSNSGTTSFSHDTAGPSQVKEGVSQENHESLHAKFVSLQAANESLTVDIGLLRQRLAT
jgi:hypothetical protein